MFGSAKSVLYSSQDQPGFTWCTDLVGAWSQWPLAKIKGCDACLVSGFIIKELIRSCLIVSSATIERIQVGTTAKIAQ